VLQAGFGDREKFTDADGLGDGLAGGLKYLRVEGTDFLDRTCLTCECPTSLFSSFGELVTGALFLFRVALARSSGTAFPSFADEEVSQRRGSSNSMSPAGRAIGFD